MFPTWTAIEQLLLRRQDSPSHLFHMSKGFWLEMGDYMGHFMDMKMLSFQVNPSLKIFLIKLLICPVFIPLTFSLQLQ